MQTAPHWLKVLRQGHVAEAIQGSEGVTDIFFFRWSMGSRCNTIVNYNLYWVTHIRVSKYAYISSDNGLSPVRCHYWNQYSRIVNWTHGETVQWNLNKIHWIYWRNEREHVVCKMAAILSRPHCVNTTHFVPDYDQFLPWAILRVNNIIIPKLHYVLHDNFV